MPTEPEPSVPPEWLVKVRSAVYFAAQYWWCIVPSVILLARLGGLEWGEALVAGLVALAAILASPIVLGVLIALVSHKRHERSQNRTKV